MRSSSASAGAFKVFAASNGAYAAKARASSAARYDRDRATEGDNPPGALRIAAPEFGDILRRRDAESKARENAEHTYRALDHAVLAELLAAQQPGRDDGCGQIRALRYDRPNEGPNRASGEPSAEGIRTP